LNAAAVGHFRDPVDASRESDSVSFPRENINSTGSDLCSGCSSPATALKKSDLAAASSTLEVERALNLECQRSLQVANNSTHLDSEKVSETSNNNSQRQDTSSKHSNPKDPLRRKQQLALETKAIQRQEQRLKVREEQRQRNSKQCAFPRFVNIPSTSTAMAFSPPGMQHSTTDNQVSHPVDGRQQQQQRFLPQHCAPNMQPSHMGPITVHPSQGQTELQQQQGQIQQHRQHLAIAGAQGRNSSYASQSPMTSPLRNAMDSTVAPAPLFERLVTEEVAELKTYARIIETQNRRLADLELSHDDLERRLEIETQKRMSLEQDLDRQNRDWQQKYEILEKERDSWKTMVNAERAKNERLLDQVYRKDKEIHRFIQRKVRYYLNNSVEWRTGLKADLLY